MIPLAVCLQWCAGRALAAGASERARAAASQLKLDFVPGFCLVPGLGLGLSFQLHPCGVLAAGLPFGLLSRDTLRCLVRSG